MKYVNQEVYLIAKPQMDELELDGFLRDVEASTWETDAPTAGEMLPEVAGRVCYMSFTKPRPGGNEAYLEHIKHVGHGSVFEHSNYSLMITGVSRALTHELVRHRAGFAYCLAGDTVVYGGSKQSGKFNGVKKTWTLDQLYAWSNDPKRKGRLKLIKVRCLDGDVFVRAGIKAITQSGVKPLFRLQLEDGKSIKCSADHRFLTEDGWKPVSALAVGVRLATNGVAAKVIPEAYLVRKYQVEGLTWAEIAKELGCSEETVRKYGRKYKLTRPKGAGMTGRKPWNTGKTYTTGYKHDAETRAQLSAQKQGERNHRWKGAAATPQAGRRRAQVLYPDEPCIVCGVMPTHRHHKDRNPLNNARSNIEFRCPAHHQELHLEEDGPPNVLKVRWQAITSIEAIGTAQTYDIEVDHPAHNFVANGFVTHNSQLSQRYVDESAAEVVLPPDIDMDDDARAVWCAAVEQAHQAYVRLVEILDLKYSDITDKTLRRKKARQVARSVLPNATETKLVATANVRAWRHFLEMRGSQHADDEIRNLALKVHAVLAKEAPNLFGDYKRVEFRPGEFELATPYRKV